MASAVIGALRVNLSANTAAFSTGLKNAESGLSRFAAQAKKAFAGVALAMAGVAAGLTAGFKSTVNEADKLTKMAQSIGIDTNRIFILAFYGLAYSLFPYLVVDRLTMWEAASAPESLMIILIGTLIVLPAIIGYTIYAYFVFWGKARELTYE